MLVILDKLNFYLHKFWLFLKPRRKLGLVSFVILSSFVLVVWFAGTSFAQADAADWLRNFIIEIMLTIAGWFIKLTFFILKFVIEVAGYNGFIDSSAVIVGWVMVRDVTNMFFVVVLLVISFGTILGLEQYEYKKLLVKLLMAAVIVNFSRIICGVIIDIAQVIMITFVNGIAATAAGNLVNMFGIEKIFALTENRDTSGGAQFLAGVAAITFSAIMMMTMLTFLFLLLARMMALWILIVLSPFAFVLNVLPQTQKYAGQWWSEFGGNVVAGPIIAFFLWLSFVTVGAGNAHDQIAEGNPQALQESSNPQETSTGLTEIMSWAQMANFAIAIGMLLAGAKMAQQLGAAGGSMMGKAGEFGKKVAMTASGLTAARWAGAKALSGAKGAGKYAFMKTPFVGGEALQRKGRSIKAWAQYKTIKKGWFGLPSRESRLIAAGKRIETAYGENKDGTKKSPFHSRAWARMGLWVAPAAFKEEYTSDKEARAKYAEEQMEHLVSTSKTPIGKEKTEAEADLQKLKDTGAKIKARKLADVLEQRGGVDQEIAAEFVGLDEAESKAKLKELEKSGVYTDRQLSDYNRLVNADKSAVQAEQINATLAAVESRRRAEAKEGEFGGKAGVAREELAAKEKAASQLIESKITSDRELKELEAIKELLMGEGRDKQKTISLVKAEIENLKEDQTLITEESTAEARAAKFRERQDDLRANQVLSEHQAKVAKRESERVNSMSWEDKSFALQTMPARIGHIDGQITAAQNANNQKEAQRLMEIKKRTLRRSAALRTALVESGREGAELADGQSLKAIGWDEVVDDSNRMRAEVSAIVGRVIKNNVELDDAVEELYDAYGGLEKAQGALTMLSNANKSAAMKGVGSRMGMFGQRTGANGRLEIFLGQPDANQPNVINASQVNKGAGSYPTKEAELDHRKWTSAAGYARIKIDANGSSQIAGFDADRAEQLAAIFAGKNALFMSQMQNYFFNSLNGAEVNAQNKAEYEVLLKKISEVLKDSDAREKFEERAAELLKKLGAARLP